MYYADRAADRFTRTVWTDYHERHVMRDNQGWRTLLKERQNG